MDKTLIVTVSILVATVVITVIVTVAMVPAEPDAGTEAALEHGAIRTQRYQNTAMASGVVTQRPKLWCLPSLTPEP